MFSSPFFAVRSQPLALHEPAFHRGPDAVPSKDYSRWPPCAAGFFREGREAENAQQQKKDYENIYKFRFKAPEPDRTAQAMSSVMATGFAASFV
jgi:hypothetical protein